MFIKHLATESLFLGLSIAVAASASCQDYPHKPIRILTGNAGSAVDFGARLISQGISGPLNQSVIVDNRDGNIPFAIVAKAPADGYTLLYAGTTFFYAPLMQKLPFDPVKDFVPISLLIGAPQILVVSPTVPAKSVNELIAIARAKPGELNYAAGNTGGASHLAGELFKSLAHVDIVRIAYKGSTASILGDLVAGQVHMMFESPTVMMPQIKAGKLRGLAVTSLQPSALLPGLPTVAASVPGFEILTVGTIFAPAKTPATVVTRLNHESLRVLQQPLVVEKFANTAASVVGSSPEELGTWMKAAMASMGKVVQDAGIRLD